MSESPTAIGLLADERLLAPDACKLAGRFGLPVLKRPPASGLYLRLTAQGLELQQAGPAAHGPVRVEFAAGAMAHRGAVVRLTVKFPADPSTPVTRVMDSNSI